MTVKSHALNAGVADRLTEAPVDTQTLRDVAAVIDNDGRISINRQNKSLIISIRVSTSDRQIIKSIGNMFGGSIKETGKTWVWRVASRRAEIVLRQVCPFLVLKSEQGKLAMSMRDHMRCNGTRNNRNANKDSQVVAFRDEARKRMNALNSRAETSPSG